MIFSFQNSPVRNVTKRFVLQVGFSCNARCIFCYYRESLKKRLVRDLTLDEVKKRLLEGRKLGKDQVDLSGGEPTIRPDIFEILEFARNIGYKKICIITNGLKMDNENFCHQLIRAGMNDVLFSIHSPIEDEHDKLVAVKGAWQKVMTALKNISTTNIEYRINFVVTNLNYLFISKMLELLKPYHPWAVNLLVFNPSNETVIQKEDPTRIADYNVVSQEISRAISKYKNNFRTINVRFLPFCLLKGQEEHIRTLWQKMYEDQEWDPYLNIKYNRGRIAVFLSFLAGCFLYPFRTPKYGWRNFYTLFNEILTTFRQVYFYKHLSECKNCSLWKICPGLPRDYLKRFPNRTQLFPYKLGKTVEDPLYFCKNYKENFESLRLSDEKK